MARLLLIDDDPVVARAVGRTLVRNGHEVEVCSVALDALDRVHAERFDLVITDFRMPGIDGLKLASRIAAEIPDLPVILLTGSFDIDLARVEAVGVVAVIAKPVDLELLLASIREHAPATTRQPTSEPERSS